MKKTLYAAAAICLAAALCAAKNTEHQEHAFPRHKPVGTGRGTVPGRVVWAHEPSAVNWDGSGFWWQTEHFSEQTVSRMVKESIALLGEKKSAADGWDALFRFSNHSRGRNSGGGYKRGEKIAVKANINGSGVFGNDDSGRTAMSYTNPVLLKCLLLSLVEDAGISPGDITVYDVSRIFPKYMEGLCTEGKLSGVRFIGRNNAQPDKSSPIIWSRKFEGRTNYLPMCVTEADYLVNLANLKGHSYGITLCAKNHFGSFLNGNEMRPPEGANLHQWLTAEKMKLYSPLTDLMANARLGGKTVLYMLDALICAPSEGAAITEQNSRWQQSPFNGHFTASLFTSQDPVAIDSVGADFLISEPAVTEHNRAAASTASENYLHEAAAADSPPSGTKYTDGAGNAVKSLGVHEHWNDSMHKQYSRNLGAAEGIELVKTGL